MSPLEGKEKTKSKKANVEGQKILPGDQLKIKKLQMHVTALEYTNIQVLYKASTTLSDNFGDRLTYRGRIVPLAESTVYKGQVNY